MSGAEALQAHRAGGATTLCRAWSIVRRDGVVLGFTDHDLPLAFDGVDFAADGGMSARALEQGNGLAVDNSEALGVLSHAAIRAEDLRAGRYDGAAVTIWEVNWADPDQRAILFRGSLGEILEQGGSFVAELRGLAEALGQVEGRVYAKGCSAILGDAACRVDLAQAGYRAEAVVTSVREARVLQLAPLEGFDLRWFERGRLEVLDGAAQGLVGVIKADRWLEGAREIALWQGLRLPLAPGDRVLLEAGCDKRAETCRLKFHNFLNFQGFPHIPGEDWVMAHPGQAGVHDGGSRG